MRIAIDCRSVYPGGGGIGSYALGLVRCLAGVDSTNDYTLLLPRNRDSEPVVRAGNFQEVTTVAGMVAPLWEQLQLPSLLGRLAIGLYHSPCFSTPVVRGPWKTVATIHDVVFFDRPDLVAPDLCRHLARSTRHSLEAADAVVTVSEFSRRRILDAYEQVNGRLHVIPPSVNPAFRQGPKDVATDVGHRWNLPTEYFLCVGALEPKKNVATVLRAYRAFLDVVAAKGRARTRLVFVGPLEPTFDFRGALKAAGVEEPVLHLQNVPANDLAVIYSGAKALLFLSLYEGFGLPALEAMLCGCPVIVARAASLPEVVGEAAMLVDPADVQAVVQAMARLDSDERLRRKLIALGRAQAERFDSGDSARRMRALYEQLAIGSRKSELGHEDSSSIK
jgi:glycosyltransferase involved in cell wall biosynthesis